MSARCISVRVIGFVLLGCGPKNAPVPETADDTGISPPTGQAEDVEAEWNEPDRPNVVAGPETGEQTSGSPFCDQWIRCCKDYAITLGQLEGSPESTVQTQLEACRDIEQAKGMEGSEQACRSALEAMGEAMDAMKAVEGFVVPASCIPPGEGNKDP
jgi:hypothetical protein